MLQINLFPYLPGIQNIKICYLRHLSGSLQLNIFTKQAWKQSFPKSCPPCLATWLIPLIAQYSKRCKIYHNILIQSCWSLLLNLLTKTVMKAVLTEVGEIAQIGTANQHDLPKVSQPIRAQQNQSSWTHLLLWFHSWNLKISVEKNS